MYVRAYTFEFYETDECVKVENYFKKSSYDTVYIFRGQYTDIYSYFSDRWYYNEKNRPSVGFVVDRTRM